MRKRLELENLTREQKALSSIYRNATRRIAASPSGICPIDMTVSILKLYHTQSCGKCVPCRVGIGQVILMLERILNAIESLKEGKTWTDQEASTLR